MDREVLVLLIVVVLGLMAGITLYIAKKKGLISENNIGNIVDITGKLEKIATELANGSDELVFDIVNLIVMFINKAVLAAENAWYHNEISKEERKDYSLVCFNNFLSAYGIGLTEAQWATIDILITAACEEMGHNKNPENEK